MESEESRILEYRKIYYEPFYNELNSFFEIVEDQDPKDWWLSSMLKLRYFQKSIQDEEILQEIRDFAYKYLNEVEDVLLSQMEEETEDRVLASHLVAHEIADVFYEPDEIEEIEVKEVGLDELNENELLDIKKENEFVLISIFSTKDNQWYTNKIPRERDGNILLAKGGLCRVVLKILAGAPESTINAELPLNDMDFIARGDMTELYRMAESVGGGKDGVEMVEDIDYQQIFMSRDLDLNGSLLSERGLVFSKNAFEAAKNGKISILANRRGIYGTEFFHFEGIRMIKNRGMMRLLKTVAEGKALEFDFLPLNRQVDLGIYWLVLANRFAKKENAGEILDRLYSLGLQTGQVLPGEENIFEVLDRVHSRLPFYRFDAGKLDSLGLAKWLYRKLFKQIDKSYREMNNIPTFFPFVRSEGDTIPYTVSLKDYLPNEEVVNGYSKRWDSFLLRCSERNKYYEENVVDQMDEFD